MAYKINRDDEYIVIPDGVTSARQVRKIMKQQKTPEFYELEAAEVLECLLDDDDITGDDYSEYGYIMCRMVISNKGTNDIIKVAPLNSDIKRYPYPGEYVIVVEYLGQKFYTQKLNLRNRTDTNSMPGLSRLQAGISADSTKENLPPISNSNIKMLQVSEGDITLEGRFGNTIHFGSNIKRIKTEDGDKENTGIANSPNIIIRAGQGVLTEGNKPVQEDINLDSSSLWMTTNQVVPFKKSSEKAHGKTVPQKYDGKQIIINSDRIVFNSKLNSIHAFSKNEISMSAVKRINL